LPVKIGTADVDISKAPLKVADEPKGDKSDKADKDKAN
jgi:hypothetical protein